eukprot:6203216-Pleurochrysis_carterae.AAC.2
MDRYLSVRRLRHQEAQSEPLCGEAWSMAELFGRNVLLIVSHCSSWRSRLVQRAPQQLDRKSTRACTSVLVFVSVVASARACMLCCERVGACVHMWQHARAYAHTPSHAPPHALLFVRKHAARLREAPRRHQRRRHFLRRPADGVPRRLRPRREAQANRAAGTPLIG